MSRTAKQTTKASTTSTAQSDVALLKAENEKLKAQIADLTQKKDLKIKKRSFWRSTFAGLSATIAIVAFMLFNIAFWAQRTVVDNDQFIATVSPIIKDEAVQKTLQAEISKQIFSRIDIESELTKVLPDNLDFIAAPFASQVESFTTDKIGDVLQTTQVAQVWTTVLSTTHEKLMAYIQNPDNNGVLTVDEVYKTVGDQLQNSQVGFLFGKNLPTSIGSITLREVTWLPKARQALNVLDQATKQLALVTVVFTSLAIGLSRKRFSMVASLLSFNLVFIAATLLALGIGSWQAGVHVASQYQDAAVAVYGIVTAPLVAQTQGFAALFIAILAVMLVGSNAAWVNWLRAKLRAGLDWVWGLFKLNITIPKWLEWFASNRVVIGWTLTAVMFIAFALRLPPTVSGVVAAVIVSTIAVFVLEVVASFCRVAAKRP